MIPPPFVPTVPSGMGYVPCWYPQSGCWGWVPYPPPVQQPSSPPPDPPEPVLPGGQGGVDVPFPEPEAP